MVRKEIYSLHVSYLEELYALPRSDVVGEKTIYKIVSKYLYISSREHVVRKELHKFRIWSSRSDSSMEI